MIIIKKCTFFFLLSRDSSQFQLHPTEPVDYTSFRTPTTEEMSSGNLTGHFEGW